MRCRVAGRKSAKPSSSNRSGVCARVRRRSGDAQSASRLNREGAVMDERRWEMRQRDRGEGHWDVAALLGVGLRAKPTWAPTMVTWPPSAVKTCCKRPQATRRKRHWQIAVKLAVSAVGWAAPQAALRQCYSCHLLLPMAACETEAGCGSPALQRGGPETLPAVQRPMVYYVWPWMFAKAPLQR